MPTGAEALIFVGLAGGAAYVATRKGDAAPVTKAPTAPFKLVSGFTAVNTGTAGTAGAQNPFTMQTTRTTFGKLSSTQRSLLTEAEKRIRAEYERLSSDAKKAGAKAINEKLGTNLKGDESFSEVTAAVGGVAGAAACSATGVGTTVAGLCAVAGAYLGKSIGDYVAGAWPDVRDWAKGVGGDIEDGLKNLYDSTIGKLF